MWNHLFIEGVCEGRFIHYDCSPSVWELGPWSAYEMAPSPPETRVGVVYLFPVICAIQDSNVHIIFTGHLGSIQLLHVSLLPITISGVKVVGRCL